MNIEKELKKYQVDLIWTATGLIAPIEIKAKNEEDAITLAIGDAILNWREGVPSEAEIDFETIKEL